jgi:hypothetical protein
LKEKEMNMGRFLRNNYDVKNGYSFDSLTFGGNQVVLYGAFESDSL